MRGLDRRGAAWHGWDRQGVARRGEAGQGRVFFERRKNENSIGKRDKQHY